MLWLIAIILIVIIILLRQPCSESMTTPRRITTPTIDSGHIMLHTDIPTFNAGNNNFVPGFINNPPIASDNDFIYKCEEGAVIQQMRYRFKNNKITQVCVRCSNKNDYSCNIPNAANMDTTTPDIYPGSNLFATNAEPGGLGFNRVTMTRNGRYITSVMGQGYPSIKSGPDPSNQCPPNTFVNGVYTKHDSNGISNIGFTCGQPPVNPPAYNSSGLKGSGSNGSPVNFRCPAGEVITEVTGSSSSIIDKLCLKCSGSDEITCFGKNTSNNFGPIYPSSVESAKYTTDQTKIGTAVGFNSIPIKINTNQLCGIFNRGTGSCPSYNLTCPNNTYAAGIIARTGDKIFRFGTVCAPKINKICPNNTNCNELLGRTTVQFNREIDLTNGPPIIRLTIESMRVSKSDFRKDFYIKVDPASITTTSFDIVYPIGPYNAIGIGWTAYNP